MLWPTIENAASLFGFGHGSQTLSTTRATPVMASSFASSDNPLLAGISSDNSRAVVSPTAILSTPYPTYTPYPTPTVVSFTPTPAYTLASFLYSYYDPNLGGVNCHSANWDGHKCADTTASGIRWSQYVGHAVAIPPSWYDAGLGYGSVLRVISPSSMLGDYTVIDLCPGCEAKNWPDGQYRLDFLDDRQRLTWAYPMQALIVNIVPPVEVH